MALAGQVAIQSANTAYMAMGEEIFSRVENQNWQLWVKQVPCNGASLEIDVLGASPEVREMVSNQRFASLRALARRKAVVPYSADAIEIPRSWIDGDKSGLFEAKIKDYLSIVGTSFWWAPSVALLVTNPTCIDGLSLLNDSHTYGYTTSGTTYDNKETGAFTPAMLNTIVSAMTNRKHETGQPMGTRPTHLMVNPAVERDAKDAIGVQRPIPVDSSGVPNATASVVAAVQAENWLKGELTLIVEARLTTSTDYLAMDLSKPNVRPIVGGMQGAPEPIIKGIDSEGYFQRDVFAYGARARGALMGAFPQVIHGRLG